MAASIIQVPYHGQYIESADQLKASAVYKIERWWMAVKDKRLFQTLKYAVCSAEHSLTHEILRKLSPREASLLKDPSMQTKIKFRLDGTTFPPTVVFKIYSQAKSVKYISGRNIIHPVSEATEEARLQMGNRLFYDQLLFDCCHHHQHSALTDITDVTTMKEYMKYTSNLDETPAMYGGKENYWRKLSLDVLPRYSAIYKVMELIQTPSMINSCSRSCSSSPSQMFDYRTYKVPSKIKVHSSTRYSQLALKRAQNMRKHFSQEKQSDATTSVTPKVDHIVDEDDVLELYQWAQELSFEDLN